MCQMNLSLLTILYFVYFYIYRWVRDLYQNRISEGDEFDNRCTIPVSERFIIEVRVDKRH